MIFKNTAPEIRKLLKWAEDATGELSTARARTAKSRADVIAAAEAVERALDDLERAKAAEDMRAQRAESLPAELKAAREDAIRRYTGAEVEAPAEPLRDYYREAVEAKKGDALDNLAAKAAADAARDLRDEARAEADEARRAAAHERPRPARAILSRSKALKPPHRYRHSRN